MVRQSFIDPKTAQQIGQSRPAMADPLHILVLDGAAGLAESLARPLRTLGCEVGLTRTPEEFMTAFCRLAPGHLLIDLSTAEAEGSNVLRHLADLGCRARIIVTGDRGLRLLEAMRQTARGLGLDVIGRLEKPLRAAQIVRLIREHPAPGPNPTPLGSPFAARGPAPDPRAQTAPPARRPARMQGGISIDDVTRGLAAGEFRLYLQDRFGCANRHLAGQEALARWHHPEMGVLAPRHFLGLLESHGQEHLLAIHMLDLAMAHLASQNRVRQVSVNISLQTFRRPCFREEMQSLRRRHGIAPEQLVLELTETGNTDILPGDIAALTRLRIEGYQLAADDFGVGMSSLQRLIQLPFTEIKIDRMFVGDITRFDEPAKIVTSIIAMGRALDMMVTAEGVEDEATLAALTDLGCDLAQGHYFGRPHPARLPEPEPEPGPGSPWAAKATLRRR